MCESGRPRALEITKIQDDLERIRIETHMQEHEPETEAGTNQHSRLAQQQAATTRRTRPPESYTSEDWAILAQGRRRLRGARAEHVSKHSSQPSMQRREVNSNGSCRS